MDCGHDAEIDLAEVARKLGRKHSSLPVFLDPKVHCDELVAEIEYRGWTDDAKLRPASVKGIRDYAEADSIYSM